MGGQHRRRNTANLSCNYDTYATGTGSLTGNLDASAISGAAAFVMSGQNGSSVSSAEVAFGPTSSFSFLAPTGNDRVMVFAAGSASDCTVAAKNFPSQAVPGVLNGGDTVVFGAAAKTTPATVAYNNVPAGFAAPGLDAWLQMAGTNIPVLLTPCGTATQYPLLPAAAIENEDFYLVEGYVSESGSDAPTVYAGSATSGGPVSLAFPNPWSYAGPAAAATPEFNLNYAGYAGKSGVLQEAAYSWTAGSSGSNKLYDQIRLLATTSYQGGSRTLTVPSLSGVTGFFSAPASGTPVSWFAEVWQYSYGAAGTPAVNSTWTGVETVGAFSVP